MKQPIDPITLNPSWPSTGPDFRTHDLDSFRGVHQVGVPSLISPYNLVKDYSFLPAWSLGLIAGRAQGHGPARRSGQQQEKSHKLKLPQRFYGQNHELDLSISCWSRIFFLSLISDLERVVVFLILLANVVKQLPITPRFYTRWWFQIFFIFTPTWGRFPIWLIFLRGVGSTTNQYCIYIYISFQYASFWRETTSKALDFCFTKTPASSRDFFVPEVAKSSIITT